MTKKRKTAWLTVAGTACAAALVFGGVATGSVLETKAEETSAIKDATVTLGSCISLRYYVESDVTEGLSMSFTMNGEKTIATELSTDSYGKYSAYEVAPQCIGDDVVAELYEGDNKLSEKTYSVEEYCKKAIAGETASASLKTLCADILAYGAAAQNYVAHNTEDLVMNENAGTPTEFTALTTTDKGASGTTDSVTAFTSATLYFDSTNSIYFIFETDDVDSVEISLTRDGETEAYEVIPYGSDAYAIVTDDIYALDFDAVYAATIKTATMEQTATYSIGSYVYAMQNGENETAELVKALWNYGTSSKAYYYMPTITLGSETEIGVKAGETFAIPSATATNLAGEELTVTVKIDGVEYTDSTATFYQGETHVITYVAESNGCVAEQEVTVTVDYDGINLANENYLVSSTLYGIYGMTMDCTKTNSVIGVVSAKQIYDEKVSVAVSHTSQYGFVGDIIFTLRGGANADLTSIDEETSFSYLKNGLAVMAYRSGGSCYIKLYYNGTQIAASEALADGTFSGSFALNMQAKDVKDENGNVTGVQVVVSAGGTQLLDYTLDVTDGQNADALKPAWLACYGGANTDWMKADLYIPSLYLNAEEIESNLLMGNWSRYNSSSVLKVAMDSAGLVYNMTDTHIDNTFGVDFGGYYDEKVYDQKIKVTADIDNFDSSNEVYVFLRGNNNTSNWRWARSGLYVSYSASNGVGIGYGTAAWQQPKALVTYDNDAVKAKTGKTITELFADGVTLEMQAVDVKDGDTVTEVKVYIWINGVLINDGGYSITDKETYANAFTSGNMMLFGRLVSDSIVNGHIIGVYLTDAE